MAYDLCILPFIQDYKHAGIIFRFLSPGSCDCVAKTRLKELLSVFPNIFYLFYKESYQKLKSRLLQYSLSFLLESRVTTLLTSLHHCLGCKKCSQGAWIVRVFGEPLGFSFKNQLIHFHIQAQ